MCSAAITIASPAAHPLSCWAKETWIESITGLVGSQGLGTRQLFKRWLDVALGS